MLLLTSTPEFSLRVPQFRGAYLQVEVVNSPTSPELWAEIEATARDIQTAYTPDTLKLQPGIAATRAAYKACGKDPSRYRPASEQLARRVLQGKSLYSVDTLVDIGNLVSLRSGYPTGLLDRDAIVGDTVALGIGQADEPYEGIGRGSLNVEGLPLYRDALGGIASPTSDSVRTRLLPTTTRLLFIINGYDGHEARIQQALDHATTLLQRYAQAATPEVRWF